MSGQTQMDQSWGHTGGVELAIIVQVLLHPTQAPPDQEHGWTLDQAVDRIAHLKPSTADLREALVYQTIQWIALHHRNGERERRAISDIRTALRDMDRRLEQDRRTPEPTSVDGQQPLL